MMVKKHTPVPLEPEISMGEQVVEILALVDISQSVLKEAFLMHFTTQLR